LIKEKKDFRYINMKALNHKEINNKFWMFFIAAFAFALVVFTILFFTIDIVPDQIANNQFEQIMKMNEFNRNQFKIGKKIDDINFKIQTATSATKGQIEQDIDEIFKPSAADTSNNELLKKIIIVLKTNLDLKIQSGANGNTSAEIERLKRENSTLQSEKIKAQTDLLDWQKTHP